MMTNNSSRNNQDDLIRVIAMIFVMIFHSGFALENNLIISTFVLPCNSLFFMLSGKYSLQLTFSEKKDYYRFYIRKFINLFVPLFIFSVLFFVYSHLHTNESIPTLLVWFGYGFLGDTINGVYWFPYTLLGIMLSTPFLCKLVQNLSDFELKLLFVISFFWQFVSVILVQDLLNATTNIFRGWIFVPWVLQFVMGYSLERLIKTDKQRNRIMFLGVIGLAITLLRFILFGTSSADLFTESPIYLFYIVGIYLFLGKVCIIKNDKIKKVISFLAKHSYSMYLMHVFPLEVLKTNNPILNLYPNINAYILYVIVIIIVFITSLIGAIIMDNLLLKPLKRFLNRKLLS